jgi:hypothetical protein
MEETPTTPPPSEPEQPRRGLFQRIKGIILYQLPAYREIAKDRSAMLPALAIVVLTSLLSGAVIGAAIGFAFQNGQILQEVQQQYDEMGVNIDVTMLASIGPGVWIGSLTAFWLVFGLFAWLVPGWLSALAANKFVDGQTTTAEVLRVYGFVFLFSLAGLVLLPVPVPFLSILATFGLSMVGNTFGIRAAAGVDMGSAVVCVLFGFAMALLAGLVLYCCGSFGIALLIASIGGI